VSGGPRTAVLVVSVVNEKLHRHSPDSQIAQTDKRHNKATRALLKQPPIEVVASRLREADLSTDRFIDVKEGRKQSFDHVQCEPDQVSGNHGVYCGQGLLGVDIDDRDAWNETPGAGELPDTFIVSTPHDGNHRYYRVRPEVPRSISAVTGGSLNPSRQWGELYTSKYLVGPGSEIYDCQNPDCYRCKTDNPGRYEIEADRPIAEISSDEIVPLLHDRSETPDARQTAIAEFNENIPDCPVPNSRAGSSTASGGKFTFQLQLGEEKPADPDKRILWGIVRAQANGSKEGARFDEVLDRADENGIGCRRTASVVRSWLACGALRRASDPNRLIPQREGWEQ